MTQNKLSRIFLATGKIQQHFPMFSSSLSLSMSFRKGDEGTLRSCVSGWCQRTHTKRREYHASNECSRLPQPHFRYFRCDSGLWAEFCVIEVLGKLQNSDLIFTCRHFSWVTEKFRNFMSFFSISYPIIKNSFWASVLSFIAICILRAFNESAIVMLNNFFLYYFGKTFE